MSYFSPSIARRLHQPDERHLRGAVIGLPEVSVKPGRRRGHDDAPVALRAHALPDRLGADRRAHQVNLDHQPEVRQAHLGEALVAQDPGVVHENVHATPRRERAAHHRGDRALHR